MTTNNSVNTGLSGTTGSGNFVGATSPTLVTPTLGVANGTSIQWSDTTKGLIGTTTNDNASAGFVGEFVISVLPVGSAVGLTTSTPVTVTSISLTAGDWDVGAELWLTGGSTTQIALVNAGISTTNNTLSNVPAVNNGYFQYVYPNVIVIGTNGVPFYPADNCRMSLAGTTTVYFVVNAIFSTSTLSAYGKIWARRMR